MSDWGYTQPKPYPDADNHRTNWIKGGAIADQNDATYQPRFAQAQAYAKAQALAQAQAQAQAGYAFDDEGFPMQNFPSAPVYFSPVMPQYVPSFDAAAQFSQSQQEQFAQQQHAAPPQPLPHEVEPQAQDSEAGSIHGFYDVPGPAALWHSPEADNDHSITNPEDAVEHQGEVGGDVTPLRFQSRPQPQVVMHGRLEPRFRSGVPSSDAAPALSPVLAVDPESASLRMQESGATVSPNPERAAGAPQSATARRLARAMRPSAPYGNLSPSLLELERGVQTSQGTNDDWEALVKPLIPGRRRHVSARSGLMPREARALYGPSRSPAAYFPAPNPGFYPLPLSAAYNPTPGRYASGYPQGYGYPQRYGYGSAYAYGYPTPAMAPVPVATVPVSAPITTMPLPPSISTPISPGWTSSGLTPATTPGAIPAEGWGE